jgi:DNA-binding NtrC family response regulator
LDLYPLSDSRRGSGSLGTWGLVGRRLLVLCFTLLSPNAKADQVHSEPGHEALVNADWPGNIRELENFIERCVIFTQGDELNVPRAELRYSSRPATSTFQEAERQVIINAVRAASGRIAGKGGAAERLGLKRTTLQNKMRKLNIHRADHSA